MDLFWQHLTALNALARRFFGVDSAPMHIAVKLLSPSVGTEDRAWMMSCRMLIPAHFSRPCSNYGCGGSKVSSNLTGITFEQLVNAVHEVMGDE